jgi:Flp pilus assembly protein CpaB
MQRRLFIVLGVVLAVVAVGIFLFVFLQQDGVGIGGPPAPPEEVAEEEPTSIPMVEVIVARQPIPRGGEFVAGALGRTSYPEGSVPPNAIVNEAETIGKIANSEIVQGQIIVYDLLRDKTDTTIGIGEAAFDIPSGHVMVAFPINKQTSVAYALQPGDVVDVLMTFSIVDIDSDFQTILPNKFSFLLQDIQGSGDEATISISLSPAIDEGRLNIENELFPGFEFPREEQRPRRVAQLTVQKGKVIKVGPWIEAQAQEPVAAEEGAPAPTPTLPDIVSLAVTPQNALVLLWARQSGAYMELALRAAGDEAADHSTEAVTLQYMLTRFNIAVPPRIEFGIDRSAEAVTTELAPAQPAGE